MSWTRGVTAQQRRRYFRSTRFTERKEACSTDAASSFSQDFDDPVSWWSNGGGGGGVGGAHVLCPFGTLYFQNGQNRTDKNGQKLL